MTTTDEIRKSAGVLFESEQAVEVRALVAGGGPRSGYFDNLDLLAEKVAALAAEPSTTGIYWTVNPPHRDLLARKNYNRIGFAERGESTKDEDIIQRRWLPIDIDPARKSGISATDAEKAAGFKKGDDIAAWLHEKGWPAPIVADSGNGPHLLYRIDLPNDASASNLIVSCLRALAARFSDETVKVDTTVGNAARIVRAYGTPNRKGSSTTDRPHRPSRLCSVPDVLESVPVELLQALAAEVVMPVAPAPGPSSAAGTSTAGDRLDLRMWLEKHAGTLPFTVIEKPKAGHTFFGELEPCPWSADHTSGAYIGQLENGGIYARCQHSSCGGAGSLNRWHEILTLVEPEKPKSKKHGKADGDMPAKHLLAHFEMDGKLYLDVLDDHGTPWFAHLDDAGNIAFAREVARADGVIIVPRGLPVHQDTGMPVPIVGLPTKEAMESAVLLDADVLFKAIDEHLKRYIDMPDQDRTLFIYYLIYTWFFRKTRTAPYLRFIADTGKGKSRIVRAVADLCFYPIRAAGASSFSGIFRNKERWHGTLVVDEADFQGGAENQVISYLNLGFEAGQPFLLSDKNDPEKVHPFDPFGPKVLGMRQPFGDNATEARVLSFSPRETRRRDIPVEVDAAYDETVIRFRAHLALFALHHWSDVTTESMMDVSAIDVEPRLKQMLRPISLVLSVFLDGAARLTEYVRARQIELRRDRAASFDGLCFNLTLKLAEGTDDLRTDPKFGKYYRRDGAIQAVSPAMIASALGVKTSAVTKALRGMGFVTRETSITYDGVDSAEEGHQGRIREKKLTVTKLVVPDAQAWAEMVSRYHHPQEQDDGPGDGQAKLDTSDPVARWCPHVLHGPRYIDPPCDYKAGISGVSGKDHQEGPEGQKDTGGTSDTALHGTRPLPEAAGRYRHIQSNPNPCWRCGRAPSHYIASPSGNVADPANRYLCKGCLEALSATSEEDREGVSA